MNAPLRPNPLAAWTDFTPTGPWSDGTIVVRNLDGVGFQYSASLNALEVIPNESFSVKNANSNIITNLPAPTNGGDATNKTYVDGHAGAAGPPGPAGPAGPQGVPGNTVLYGAGAPAAATGVNGNFYIDTTAHFIYGPKASGAWPTGTSLIGPQGPQGIQGIQGPIGATGAAGNTILYGTSDPVAGTGVDGNFYINTTTHFMFGPKASGAWPAGISLIGPQGAQGPQGPQGVPGAGSPSTTLPLMDGTAAIGVSTFYARDDHVHPSDTNSTIDAGTF
jgi:hypothetical protein